MPFMLEQDECQCCLHSVHLRIQSRPDDDPPQGHELFLTVFVEVLLAPRVVLSAGSGKGEAGLPGRLLCRRGLERGWDAKPRVNESTLETSVLLFKLLLLLLDAVVVPFALYMVDI